MKKRVVGVKLSRGQGARKALFRSLVRALVKHGKITTTKTKAKMIRRRIDKLVNLSKKGSIPERRRLYALLGNDRATTDKLFHTISQQLSKNTGGYTKLIVLSRRRGDNTEMARLEWSKEVSTSKSESKSKTKEVKKVKGIKGIAKKLTKKK